MAFQDDYVLRTIGNLVTAIGRLALGKDEVDYQLPAQESQDDPVAAKYRRLRAMAEAGEINEAENLLYEQLENGQPEYLKAALGFYDHLNDYTEEFLDKADFSREEIKSGLVSVLRMYGYEGMTGLLM